MLTNTNSFAHLLSHAAPSVLEGCRSLSDLIREVGESRKGKWDATLSAREIVPNALLQLPEDITLTETAVKSLARLTGVPSTVTTWCSDQGYSDHVARYIGDRLTAIADEDARTGRPATRYFARFRQSQSGETRCRAVFSGSYGVLDNHDALDLVLRAFERLDGSEAVVRRLAHNGDDLFASLLLPDYTLALPDSEYGVGVEIGNSEVDGPFTVTGFVYRSMCANGMLMGVRESQEFSRRHIGRIDQAEIQEAVRIAVADAIGTGRQSLDAHAAAWQVQVKDAKRAIAHLGKSSRLTREQTTAWLAGYEETIAEPRSPADTVGAILNGLTAAARSAAPWERRQLESEAGRLLSPAIGKSLADIEARWSAIEERAKEVKDDELEKLTAR